MYGTPPALHNVEAITLSALAKLNAHALHSPLLNFPSPGRSFIILLDLYNVL